MDKKRGIRQIKSKKTSKKFLFGSGVFVQIFLLIMMTVAVSVLLSEGVEAQEGVPGLDPRTGQPFDTSRPGPVLGSTTNPAGSYAGKSMTFTSPAGSNVPSGTYQVADVKPSGEMFNGKPGVDVTFKASSGGNSPTYSMSKADYFKGRGYEAPKNPLGGSKPMFSNTPIAGHLVKGVFAAAMVVGVIQLAGNLFGLDESLTNSLSYAAGGGIMTFHLVKGSGFQFGGVFDKMSTGLGGYGATLFGVAAAVAIFILTYKKEEKQNITFTCKVFEPPIGGNSCEECNKYPFKTCTEYRCKSLGQACELLNKGTKEEYCAWVGRDDVTSPTITPEVNALAPKSLKLKYTPRTAVRPDSLGVNIVAETNEGCLPAFTPLQFGFTTNEPAQCKLGYNLTNKLEEMEYYVGDNNYFAYNHTQIMKLPNQELMAPLLDSGGRFNIYTRCRDANGNENVDAFVFSFCVDSSPDVTQPIIEGFSIPSKSYVGYNQDNVKVDVYVNEPADCRWSIDSKDYYDMENSMECNKETYQINSALTYVCSTTLTGIRNREANKFYFRCLDKPEASENERNPNTVSTEYVLYGSQPLDIINVKPNGTIISDTDVAKVDLEVETSNGAQANGNSTCMFSQTGAVDSYIIMYETNNYKHKQTLTIGDGYYDYFIRCFDAGGNAAESNTSFRVFVDKEAPIITRAFKEDNAIKIITNEEAECVFASSTCNYEFKEGIKMSTPNLNNKQEHYADWNDNAIYHIKCQDVRNNQPNPSQCSMVVRAVDLVEKARTD
jgi:hypothetical protein